MIAIPPRRYAPGCKPKDYLAAHALFHIQTPRYTLHAEGYTFRRYVVRHHNINYIRYVWSISKDEALFYASKHSGFIVDELFVEDAPLILNLSFQKIPEEGKED